MMISPEGYIKRFKNAEYLDLIKERNELLRFITEYEAKEMSGDRSGAEWDITPGPDVRYQMYLEYLGKLCALMQEKYSEEYVWGDRTLKKDREALVCGNARNADGNLGK